MVQVSDDEHIELTPTEARGGRKGGVILAVLVVSTLLAVVGMTVFFVGANVAPGS